MKNNINNFAATRHHNAVKYAHPDIINNCLEERISAQRLSSAFMKTAF